MVTIINFLLQSAAIFLMIAIPGFLASVALLKKSGKFNTLELFLIGLPIGMFVPGLLGILEGDIGVLFSPALAIFNVVLLTAVAAGYLLMTKTKILPEKKPAKESLLWGAGLLVVLFLAFWIRIQGLSPYYYDFDPYWYNHMTQFIIQGGQIPVHDDYVWYPNLADHRAAPLLAYVEAGWYHLYSLTNNMQSFDFNTMTLVSSMYPSFIGMLMAFAAYVWMSREYDRRIGLIAAGLMAFTPVLVEKMVAPELSPFGFFAQIFFYTAYVLSLKYESKSLAVLAAFAIIISSVGSSAGQISLILFGGIIALTSLIAFIRGKDNSKFLKLNLIIVVGSVIAFLLYLMYLFPLSGFSIINKFLPVWIGLIGGYALNVLRPMAKTTEDRLLYLSAIGIVGIVLIFLTPLHGVLDSISTTFGFVTTYTNPTDKTIAELTAAPTDFSGILGVLGMNVPFSITPIILIIAFIVLAAPFIISVFKNSKGEFDEARMLIGIVGVLPIALSGLFKAKFAAYIGLMTPIAFCMIIGELNKTKKYQLVGKTLIWIAALAVIIQGLQYMDVISKSISWYAVDVSDNNAFLNSVCTTINTEISSVSTSNMPGPVRDLIYDSKVVSMRTYCSRIPEHWLDAMFWIRDNIAGTEDRVMSWWDYGHWINTFGQSKSVTGNTHAYPIMHQEVADKLVHGNSTDLIEYMASHKAKYLLVDQDLIGKWGALVYHSCVYNNMSALAQDPGTTECDLLSSPEQIYVPKSPTSNDVCSLKSQGSGTMLKVYSSMSQTYGFGYYCIAGGSLPFLYENKSTAGIENVFPTGESGNYAMFLAMYNSDNPDRKGTFYDSMFYKGFFEGHIDGLTQVYPSTYSNKPDIPVRIYKLNE